MAELDRPSRVLVTGGAGFVGRYVVRELLSRGYRPICLVRDPARLRAAIPEAAPGQILTMRGDLSDTAALQRAAGQVQAIIHLVGIILEYRRKGQTFERVHVEGTRQMMAAAKSAGVKRFVHMSALGTRADAVSRYHQTKWEAEEIVRNSGLHWTIFRPSIIHGPDGEFMRLLRTLVSSLSVPAIPYFGDGEHKVQPVSVRDVAHCFAACLDMPETVGRIFELGGPRAYTWKELYRLAKALIPGALRIKPLAGVPVPVAKALAATLMKTPLVPRTLKFNVGQVQMSQEDSVCDTQPVERTFGIQLRDFQFELSQYADQIR